jgi:hypothetical protein
MKSISIFILVLFLSSNSHADSVLPKNYPGKDIIGKGYNVFGEFANNKSIQPYPLFNFAKMASSQSQGYDVPKRVFLKEVNEHIVETIEGSSVSEYVSNLSQDAGLNFDAFVFKASFEDHFGKESESTSGMFYYTYMDLNTKWQISLDSRNMDTLKNYLDAQFKADLATMDPASLFSEYGTHFISSAYIGGRIDYSSTTQTNEESVITEVKTSVGGKYKALSGELTNEETYDNNLRKYNTSTRLSVIGGAAEFTRDMENHQQYENWAASLTHKPALCGFDNRSLKPIWLLSSDPTRAKQLEDYFNNIVLPKHPLPIYHEKDAILDNEDLTEQFAFVFTGFRIHQDCDPPSTFITDKAGEFSYGLTIQVNNEPEVSIKSKSGFVNTVWSGGFLTVDQRRDIIVSLKPGSEIKVKFWLKEHETYEEDDQMGPYVVTFKYPFTNFHNYTDSEGTGYWQSSKNTLYKNSECNAQIFFQVLPTYNESANDFGSKGWEHFMTNDFDQSQANNKRALEFDNSTWFVQYNVALIYLIERNPMAFDKYKLISTLCPNLATTKAAYQDILDYEAINGAISNSEAVKILLKNSF